MWRDPMDELIEDLEKVVGREEGRQAPSMGDFVIYMDTLANGSSRAVAALRHNPGFRRFMMQCAGPGYNHDTYDFDGAIEAAREREERYCRLSSSST